MTTRPSRSALALLSLMIFGTACETGTGPDARDAFQATLDDYAALDAALASSAWAGFQALGERTPFGASAAIDAVATLDAVGDDGSAFAQSLAARLADGGPAGAPIISASHRGKTFVYDPAKDEYVVSTRSGAPAKGARFIVYRLDNAGRPIVGQEIGHADLIDEGDASAQDIALRLTVVQGGKTILDYRTTLDDSPTRGALTLHGFLEGDGVRLDFDVEAATRKLTSGTEFDVQFEIAIDERDFSITGEVSGPENGGDREADVDITVRHRDGSIRVEAETDNGQLDATFFVNGEVFATATGDHDHPTVLGSDGDPVTGLEALVLHRIMDSVEDVFDLLEDLLDPIDDIVFWGMVL